MKKIIIWRGHHGDEVTNLIQEAYNSPDTLLILCPPRMNEFDSFFPFLPSGEIEFKGELEDRAKILNTSKTEFKIMPSFGLFSSGTTDTKPKLILYTKENLVTACEGIFSFFKNLKIDSIYSYPQPYHIFGLSLGYIASLRFGWKLIVGEDSYSRVHHVKWVEAVKERGGSLLSLGTPTHFLDLSLYVQKNKIELPKSLTAIAGGAKVEVSMWNKMQEELHIEKPSVGYGCSEASPGVTHLTPGLRPYDNGDLGKVLPNGKITETKAGFEYVGPNVCLAIIQNDKIIFPNGKYLLTDTLEKDGRGHYFFKKRADLLLNRGGEKFSLEEIESTVKSLFYVDSVAVAIKDERLGEELGILYAGATKLAPEIHRSLNDLYKRNFRLDYIIDTAVLPINANAKFDRQAAKDQIMERL